MNRLLITAVLIAATAACNRGENVANNAAAPVTPATSNVAAAQPAGSATEWQTTAEGLRYRRLSGDGRGRKPLPTDTITFHYVGKLQDGTVFDSSVERGEPATMAIPGLIPGWQIAVPLMSVGDVYELEVPPQLGYGAEGGGPIPPNATLRFTIGLLDIAS